MKDSNPVCSNLTICAVLKLDDFHASLSSLTGSCPIRWNVNDLRTRFISGHLNTSDSLKRPRPVEGRGRSGGGGGPGAVLPGICLGYEATTSRGKSRGFFGRHLGGQTGNHLPRVPLRLDHFKQEPPTSSFILTFPPSRPSSSFNS